MTDPGNFKLTISFDEDASWTPNERGLIAALLESQHQVLLSLLVAGATAMVVSAGKTGPTAEKVAGIARSVFEDRLVPIIERHLPGVRLQIETL
jgi:hypothetical protein